MEAGIFAMGSNVNRPVSSQRASTMPIGRSGSSRVGSKTATPKSFSAEVKPADDTSTKIPSNTPRHQHSVRELFGGGGNSGEAREGVRNTEDVFAEGVDNLTQGHSNSRNSEEIVQPNNVNILPLGTEIDSSRGRNSEESSQPNNVNIPPLGTEIDSSRGRNSEESSQPNNVNLPTYSAVVKESGDRNAAQQPLPPPRYSVADPHPNNREQRPVPHGAQDANIPEYQRGEHQIKSHLYQDMNAQIEQKADAEINAQVAEQLAIMQYGLQNRINKGEEAPHVMHIKMHANVSVVVPSGSTDVKPQIYHKQVEQDFYIHPVGIDGRSLAPKNAPVLTGNHIIASTTIELEPPRGSDISTEQYHSVVTADLAGEREKMGVKDGQELAYNQQGSTMHYTVQAFQNRQYNQHNFQSYSHALGNRQMGSQNLQPIIAGVQRRPKKSFFDKMIGDKLRNIPKFFSKKRGAN